jgi:outer membrane protein TolC
MTTFVLRAALACAVAALPVSPAAQQPAAAEPLTLQQVIELAQRQGYQARAAAGTRDAARYRSSAFFSGLLPQLSARGTVPNYNRSIIPVLLPDGTTQLVPQQQTSALMAMTVNQKLPFTGGDLSLTSGLQRLDAIGAQRTWTSTPFTVAIRQDILRPNTIAWETREQEVRADFATRQYREAREDVAIQATGAFFDFYAARVALANARTNAAVNDTLYTLNKGRYEVGKIGENDLLQSELALLRARTAFDGARLDFDRTLAALRLTINVARGAPLDIAVTSSVPEVEADTAVAVAQALKNGAQVSDLELQDVQTRRRINEAKLNNGVGASVQASYGYNATAPEMNRAYQNLLDTKQLSLSVQMPLVQWGMRKELVQAAEADRDRVLSTSRGSREQTMLDAHFGALQLAQSRRQLAIAAKADTVATKRFEVALNRYVIGRIAIDNLYLAQSEKDQALQQYVASLRGYWVAYFRLRRTTLYDFVEKREIR